MLTAIFGSGTGISTGSAGALGEGAVFAADGVWSGSATTTLGVVCVPESPDVTAAGD